MVTQSLRVAIICRVIDEVEEGVSGDQWGATCRGRAWTGRRRGRRKAGWSCVSPERALQRDGKSFLSFFNQNIHLLSSARCCVYGGGGRCGFYLTCWMHVNLRFPLPRAGQTDNTSGCLLQSAHAPATFLLLLVTLIQPRDIFQEQMGHPV